MMIVKGIKWHVRLVYIHLFHRYIPRPLLWHGKKFHFRCYSLLRANMTAYLYQKGFIICAGSSYFPMSSSPSWMQPDLSQHLTNLSINKASPGHPGLVPCLMTQECSSVSESHVILLLASLLFYSPGRVKHINDSICGAILPSHCRLSHPFTCNSNSDI